MNSTPASHLEPGEIVDLVQMSDVLRALGIEVNLRTRRCCCPLHRGDNPTSFSWTDGGRWCCFRCGESGDSLDLIQKIQACSFRTALSYLASLGGVQLANTPESIAKFRKRQRQRTRLKIAARKLAEAERQIMLGAREELLSLIRLRRNAGKRLREIYAGAPKRFSGEAEAAWESLRLVADKILEAATSYCIMGFGSQKYRARFALHPEARQQMGRDALNIGYVVDDGGRIKEIL